MPAENSEIDDQTVPQPHPGQIGDDTPSTLWQILANSPDFFEHLDDRIKFHQRALPTGESINNLKPKEDVLRAWQSSVAIIAELEDFRRRAEAILRAQKSLMPDGKDE